MTDLSQLSNEQLLSLYGAPKQRPLSELTDAELSAAYNSTGVDAIKSLGVGIGKGAIGLAGLPADAGALAGKGADMLAPGASDQLRKFARFTPFGSMMTSDKIQKGVEQYTGDFYKPQTTAGEYAQTVGEFLPGALLGGGGVASRVAQVVIPALASETAGQLTKGQAAEPYARFGGALLGGAGTALASRPGTAAQAIRGQLPPDVTPQMVTQAEGLMADAARMGVTMPWSEALSQVAGRPVLSNVMRHLEAAPATEARMSAYYGNRPQEMDRAARATFDTIAPVNAAPSTIGRAVGETAEQSVTDARQSINAAARPYYDVAALDRVDPATMGLVRQTPGWQEARDAVRNDPQLGRHVTTLPENSVGFLNEVKKYLDAAAENASAPVNAQRNMQRSAGYSSDAGVVRQAGIAASPSYDMALSIERGGREYLQRHLDGPLGKIASKDTTTRQAIDALFPTSPAPNSAREIETTMAALAARNPRAASDLVRAHAEWTFNDAAKALQGGANQNVGAKFAANIAGNPQQRANLQAAVEAANGPRVWEGFNRFLEIAQATGTRMSVGARTAYNAEFLKDTATSGLIGEAAKGATNPIGRGLQFLADRYERWNLGHNMNGLADILTNPRTANQLRTLAAMPANSERARNMAAAIAISTNASRD